MERIVIEVDDATAKKWKNVSSTVREQLEKSFEKQIEIVSDKAKDANFEALLTKAREEAAKTGLTEAVLQRLLNEE